MKFGYEVCKFPIEVWGGASAESEFGAHYPSNLTSDGTNVTNFQHYINIIKTRESFFYVKNTVLANNKTVYKRH